MKKVNRGLSLVMSLLLCFCSINISLIVNAANTDEGKIIGFNQLDESIASQKLQVGASLEDVIFPESIKATVETVEEVEVRKAVEKQESIEPAVEVEPAEEVIVDENVAEPTEEVIDDETAEEPNDDSDDVEVRDDAGNSDEDDVLSEEVVDETEPENTETQTDEPAVETSEPESESTDDADEPDSVDTGFIDFLFPAMVANAAELETNEPSPFSGATEVVEELIPETEYETVVETKTAQSEITIEIVSWQEVDGKNFDSSAPATYTFKPVLATDYAVEATVPTITVNIVNADSIKGFDESVVIDGVRISVKADEGVFPDGARLSVEKVYGTDLQAVEAAVDEERPDNKNKLESYTFDIKILDIEGNEIEPDNSKGQVKVSFTLEEVADTNLETDVYHVKGEVGDLSVDNLDATETASTTVEAITDGFSFYTVEFTYNDLQYVMNGDTTVALADILSTVGLQGTVTNAVSDAPQFFSVVNTEDGWIVTANEAFDTPQKLTVTISDKDYVINVTDSQNDVLENDKYPYAKSISSNSITLSVKVASGATNVTYQWKTGPNKENLTNIAGETAQSQDYTISNPTNGTWYACTVNGVESKAVQIVKPGSDGRTWTRASDAWYISNGSMAYSIGDGYFDVVGAYEKNGVTYMLQTSYSGTWEMKSSTNADGNPSTNAKLDNLYFAFSEEDTYQVYITADLQDGQQAFSFGCDTKLGDRDTSGDYSDRAALEAFLSGGTLDYVAMIGAQSSSAASATDPAFVIKPTTKTGLKYWLGGYSGRQHYAHNIDNGNIVNAVTETDSGMTMSWTGVPSGGEVAFIFSVGDVANTGAGAASTNVELAPLPEGETTSVDTSIAPTVSDGLANQAESLSGNGDNVELKLVVAPKGESKASESSVLQNDESLHEKVKSQYQDESLVNVDVLEIDIQQIINNSVSTNLAETDEVLEIGIAYDFSGKYDPVVIRKHGSTSQTFTALSSRPTGGYTDGTFYADTENNVLYIYSNKFSTYVVAYSTVENNTKIEEVVVPTTTAGSSSNSSSSSSSKTYAKTVPVYRLFNVVTGQHFYTANKEERDIVLEMYASKGWTDEGVAFQTPVISDVPVYRVFDMKNGGYVYTVDVVVRDAYVANGYRDEGIAWYATGKTGRKVYKLTDAKSGKYIYTISLEEANTLKENGFICEDAEFVVY